MDMNLTTALKAGWRRVGQKVKRLSFKEWNTSILLHITDHSSSSDSCSWDCWEVWAGTHVWDPGFFSQHFIPAALHSLMIIPLERLQLAASGSRSSATHVNSVSLSWQSPLRQSVWIVFCVCTHSPSSPLPPGLAKQTEAYWYPGVTARCKTDHRVKSDLCDYATELS